MKKFSYYPLRQQAFVLALIHVLVTVAAAVGVSTQTINAQAGIVTQFVDILVMLGILVPQTENKTTPLDTDGRPLNPDYHYRTDDLAA